MGEVLVRPQFQVSVNFRFLIQALDAHSFPAVQPLMRPQPEPIPGLQPG